MTGHHGLPLYIQRDGLLRQLGYEHVSSRDNLGCYAGAIAAGMTIMGVPTTARDAERHWERSAGKLPSPIDMLMLDGWVLSRGLKLTDIYSPQAFNPQKYYKTGSKLIYEDFMRETTDLYGDQWREFAKSNYGEANYNDEMHRLRARSLRVPQENTRITSNVLLKRLVQGPVVVQFRGEDGRAPHAVTLFGNSGPNMVDFYDPANTAPSGYSPREIIGQLDPLAPLLAISK